MTDERRWPRGFDLFRDEWHRPASMSRFIGNVAASYLKMIDLDCHHYCPFCGEPLDVAETKRFDEISKTWKQTRRLAIRAKIYGYRIIYWVTGDGLTQPQDIEGFRVTRIDGETREMTPQQFAEWQWHRLILHMKHCRRPRAQGLLSWELPTTEDWG